MVCHPCIRTYDKPTLPSNMAYTRHTNIKSALVRATVVFLCLHILDASPYPKAIENLLNAHRNKRQSETQQFASWRYTKHAIDVLQADLNNNDLFFCHGDAYLGIQCPEEPFCSAWDQICDGEQICALDTRDQCLNRSQASFGRVDSRLCDGDENINWCHWKYQAPKRCGHDVYLKPTKKKVRIQSPRYPTNYPNDVFCFWTVSVPEGHKLSVNFMKFDTEDNYDFFTMGTGYRRENTRSVVIFKHSGKKDPNPAQFDLNTNTAWMTFKSDDYDSRKGFVIEFTDRERKEFGVMATNPFNQEPNRDCGGKIMMSSEGETILTSPGWDQNYGNNMECEWVVSIAEGLRIRIHFDTFDVEEDEDYISLGNGVSSRRAPILYKYSGRTKPTDIISRASDVWLKFVTSLAIARKGFKIILTEQPQNECGGIYTVPVSGKLSLGSPDYPNPYPHLADCLWQFRSASERRVHIGFVEFQTEYGYDVLRIGNGYEPDVNMTNLVIEHSGSNMIGQVGSLAFQSAGPVAWMQFNSDDWNSRSGFRFNVYSEESSPWFVVEDPVAETEAPEEEVAVDEEPVKIGVGIEATGNTDNQGSRTNNSTEPSKKREKPSRKRPKTTPATTEMTTTPEPTTITEPTTTPAPTTTPTTTPVPTTVSTTDVQEWSDYKESSYSSDYDSKFSISSSQ